jgi:hypothetical protein
MSFSSSDGSRSVACRRAKTSSHFAASSLNAVVVFPRHADTVTLFFRVDVDGDDDGEEVAQ